MTLSSPASIETLQALERYAQELHDFLDSLPQNLGRERFEELRSRCQKLCDESPRPLEDDRLRAAWARTQERLREMNTALADSSPKAYLLSRHEELSRTYESWVLAFRSSSLAGARASTIRVPSLRPLVGARTVFHMAMGASCACLYQFLLTRWQAMTILVCCLAVFGTLEITRRFSATWNHFLNRKLFRAIARPHEYHSTNSATYYLTALCLLTPFFSRPAVIVGVLILGFSDPAAAWFGKRFGKAKLHKQKSYVGTAAFIAVGIAISTAFLAIFYPEIALWRRLLVPAVASTAAAVAEVYSGRLDDNLTIPVAGVLAAAAFI